MPSTNHLLDDLVSAAGLAQVRSVEPLHGHGFDHEVLRATLTDARQVVLRHRQEARPLPKGRARFLADHDVRAPALLGGNEFATLYEYIPGEMLSAVIDEMTDATWRSVGTAFRRVHSVRFPSGLSGRFGPDSLILHPTDPVEELHRLLVDAESRLEPNLPFVLPRLPRLHALVDDHAERLRQAPTALLHGDVFLANIIVGTSHTTLIDWDQTRVGDAGQEIAALDERIHLSSGGSLPDAFFETYGPRPETATLHRLTNAIAWFTHGPFAGWDIDPSLDADRTRLVTGWRDGLVNYLASLGERLREF